MRYSKYSGRGNFFSLPNEVFLLGLSAGELAVYSFLKRCENRKTHRCWPSIKTIGQAVRMSENTVRKYIRQLEERGLITAEHREVITKTGEKRNGNLLFALRPIQEVVDEYYDRQLEELELAYAITIHKSQGSEYPVVILPVYSGPPMLMTRNLLYTAVTRAKQLVVLVGLRETVSAMICNDREIGRYTGLAQRIRNLYDFMHGGDIV